jgi:hypothetical protein
VAVPPPAIQTHAVQLATAIDNPIVVFSPVVEKAANAVRDAIQAEIDNPFPILNALMIKAIKDAQTLGGMANAVGQIGITLASGFPAALAKAAQLAAAGNFTGALNSFVPLFMGPFFGLFAQYNALTTFVQHQFDVAGKLTTQAMMAAWSVGPGMMLGVFGALGAVTGTVDALIKAVPSGDLGKIINAAQHGVANIASSVIGLVDLERFVIDSLRVGFANILNPPPPAPEAERLASALVPHVTAAGLPAAATLTLGALGTARETAAGATTPSVPSPAALKEVESAATAVSAVAEAPATTAVVDKAEVVGAPEGNATAAEPSSTESSQTTTTPVVRDSPVAVPGKAGVATGTTKPVTKATSAVGERISATVNKIGDGLKSAFTKPAKKAPTASEGGKSSGGGAGASGGAK